MSADVHSPTNAGPAAEGAAAPTYEVFEPASPPPSAAAPEPSSSPLTRPEVLAGGAFAGGFLAAILLKRLAS